MFVKEYTSVQWQHPKGFRSVTSLMAMGAAKWYDLTFRAIIQPVYISTGVERGGLNLMV